MANYPAPPGNRMAFDRDGSVGFAYLDSSPIPMQLSQANLRTINNEQLNNIVFSSGGGAYYSGVIFPELRDIQGVWFKSRHRFTSVGQYRAYTSTNTTNGVDGSWTDHGLWNESAFVSPGYRENIWPLTVSGIKAVRFLVGDNEQSLSNIHVYGGPSSTITRLAFWHPTLDQEVDGTTFDWEDVAQGTASTKQFRIKNTSASNTANSIAVAPEELTFPTPSVSASFTLSEDNVTFTSNINIGNLGPGDISDVLYVHRATPGSAALSVWAARLVALPGGWS